MAQVIRPWAPTTRGKCFTQVFSARLSYNLSLLSLSLTFQGFWFKSFGQKNKI